MKYKDVCPKCGSHLILKDGEYGEFLACPRFPDCRYTQPCKYIDEEYKAPNPYCKKCGHTGLLPFIKNNKVIPNAFVDCECKFDITYQSDRARLMPRDFDFPMSDTFRGNTYQYCEDSDPAGRVVNYLPYEFDWEEPKEIPIRPREQSEFRGMVLYLQKKVNEITDKKRKVYTIYK